MRKEIEMKHDYAIVFINCHSVGNRVEFTDIQPSRFKLNRTILVHNVNTPNHITRLLC